MLSICPLGLMTNSRLRGRLREDCVCVCEQGWVCVCVRRPCMHACLCAHDFGEYRRDSNCSMPRHQKKPQETSYDAISISTQNDKQDFFLFLFKVQNVPSGVNSVNRKFTDMVHVRWWGEGAEKEQAFNT